MNKRDDGGSAFPVNGYHSDEHGPYRPSEIIRDGFGGMTLRDWFAGQALVGLIALSHEMLDEEQAGVGDSMMRWQAGEAYLYADFMLKARKVGDGET